MQKQSSGVVLLLCIATVCHVISTHAQDVTSKQPDRIHEMEENDLILLNVGAKGRVVELLANELARTEIVRALLVEYARECVENVTMLEKQCLTCMIERCNNRMSECDIKGPPLSEMIDHKTSPIQGVQFLTQSPRGVDEGMRIFANKARTDILQGVPETLREQSEAIMHSEVEQSLKDLTENINTEKALKTISLHVQKAADNVHRLPGLEDKVSTIIIANEDHAISIAELLGRKLKDSRPFLKSIGHNGARIVKQMPAVLDEVNDRVVDFKQKVSGVFSRVMDTFKRVVDTPETEVMNGDFADQGPVINMANNQGFPASPNMQPQMNQFQFQQQLQHGKPRGSGFPNSNNMPMHGVHVHGQGPIRQFPDGRGRQQQFFNQRLQQQQNPFPNQPIPNHIPLSHGQFQQGPNVPPQNQQFPGPIQPHGHGPMPHGPHALPPRPQVLPPQPRGQDQFQQEIPIQGQTQNIMVQPIPGQQSQGQNQQILPTNPSMIRNDNQQVSQFQGQPQMIRPSAVPTDISNVIPNPRPSINPRPSMNPRPSINPQIIAQQTQPGQLPAPNRMNPNNFPSVQMQGRRKRHVDPDCKRLETDADTYCKTYESQCHNCTLEKRLRFEVCGDGVERARDEIKRMDQSVAGYLKAYEDYVAKGPLILKIELNDKNRLHKTNSYFDAFITAKIGPSIFRYKTKMILNIANIRATGSQVGDELWEKLWENEVFAEAKQVKLEPETIHIMGQSQEKDVHSAHAHKSSTGSRTFVSAVTVVVGIISSILMHIL